MIVTGRKPTIEELNLKNINLSLDKKGFVKTNNYKTNIDNIFAIGDITGKGFLAYTAEQDANNVAENKNSIDPIPKVVFSFPPVASVKDVNFDSYKNVVYKKSMYLSNARAQIEGERTGFIKVAIDKDSQKILGAWILGEKADELINIVSVMIKANMKVQDLSKNMFFHPGLAEIILEAIKDCF